MRFVSVALLSLASPSTQAAVAETFGYDASQAAQGGTSVAGGGTAYRVVTNPALLSQPAPTRTQFSWGTTLAVARFKSIGSVVVENNTNSDQVRSDSVDTAYPDTFGQSLGLATVVAPDWNRLAVGFAAYLPLNQLGIVDTGEPFVPEYVLYRAQTQRPQFDFAVSAAPFQDWSFGFGLHLGAGLDSKTTIFLQTNAAKSSSMRLDAKLKTRAAPFAGVAWKANDRWMVGCVWRAPLNHPNRMQVKSSARALGDLAALDFNFAAASSLYYDPMSVELGTRGQVLDTLALALQLDWQAWGKFESPAIQIQSPDTTQCVGSSCGVEIAGSQLPSPGTRDLWIPRLGLEFSPGPVLWRAGYAYRMSIYRGGPSGSGSDNRLDPAQHILSAGAGRSWGAWTLDAYATVRLLQTVHVEKAAADAIGAPGYDAGGKIYGGGISVNYAL